MPSGRGRPAREASEKRKPSGNPNVFCNLTSSCAPGRRPASERPRCPFPSFRATSGGAASCRAMADVGRKNPSRKVRQGRQVCGRGARGKNSRRGAETQRACRTLLHKRAKRKQKGGWSAEGGPSLKTKKTALRTWKAGGRRMHSRAAGVPPAKLPKSKKQAKTPMLFVISRQATRLEAPLPDFPRCFLTSFRAPSECEPESRPANSSLVTRQKARHRILNDSMIGLTRLD